MQTALDLEFVLIPNGEFLIGSVSSRDRYSQPHETPQHRLHVTDFYMLRYPVTSRQYGLFVEATGPAIAPPFSGQMGDFQKGRPSIRWLGFRYTMLPPFVAGRLRSLDGLIEAALDKMAIRGGSWRQEGPQSHRAYRSWAAPLHRSQDTGFRCCYEPHGTGQ